MHVPEASGLDNRTRRGEGRRAGGHVGERRARMVAGDTALDEITEVVGEHDRCV